MLTTTKKMGNYILQMPVREVGVTAPFGSKHNGLDLGWLTLTQNKNQPIYACDDGVVVTETPTAKARWVLEYLNFQIYSKVYKTNLFLQDFY